MIKDAIPGMNEVINDDPPKGSVVLVVGEAGTLKSAFVYCVMARYLEKHPDESGVFLTLDERRDSHLRNMASLGIKVCDRLVISDIAAFRTDFRLNTEVPVDSDVYYDQVNHILFENLERKRKPGIAADGGKIKNTMYALDSLNAYLAMSHAGIHYETNVSADVRMRNRLFTLLSLLRENEAVNFIIYEHMDERSHPEFFLADAVIELGTVPYRGETKRFVRVKKMRGVRHSLDRYMIDITQNGIEVVSKLIP